MSPSPGPGSLSQRPCLPWKLLALHCASQSSLLGGGPILGCLEAEAVFSRPPAPSATLASGDSALPLKGSTDPYQALSLGDSHLNLRGSHVAASLFHFSSVQGRAFLVLRCCACLAGACPVWAVCSGKARTVVFSWPRHQLMHKSCSAMHFGVWFPCHGSIWWLQHLQV